MAKATSTTAPTAPQAQVVVTTAATAVKRGTSSIATPVAVVWVTCHNMAQVTTGNPTPARKALVAHMVGLGIAYYTARTQVQAYLKASQGGTVAPAKLPRHVVLG